MVGMDSQLLVVHVTVLTNKNNGGDTTNDINDNIIINFFTEFAIA